MALKMPKSTYASYEAGSREGAHGANVIEAVLQAASMLDRLPPFDQFLLPLLDLLHYFRPSFGIGDSYASAEPQISEGSGYRSIQQIRRDVDRAERSRTKRMKRLLRPQDAGYFGHLRRCVVALQEDVLEIGDPASSRLYETWINKMHFALRPDAEPPVDTLTKCPADEVNQPWLVMNSWTVDSPMQRKLIRSFSRKIARAFRGYSRLPRSLQKLRQVSLDRRIECLLSNTWDTLSPRPTNWTGKSTIDSFLSSVDLVGSGASWSISPTLTHLDPTAGTGHFVDGCRAEIVANKLAPGP